MNTFGICNYDPDEHEPKVRDLVKFATYKEAWDAYIKEIAEEKRTGPIPGDLWIVYISDDVIVQREQLSLNIKACYLELL